MLQKLRILFITIIIFPAKFSVGQTIISEYPNGASCRFSLSIDSGDTLWTGSFNTGLIRCFDDTCIQFNTSNSGIASNRINVVSSDSSDRIWAGGYLGISVFDHGSWTTYNTANSGLPNDTINCIHHTISGTWIGTNAGLAYFNGTGWTIYNIQNSGIFANLVRDVAIDGNTIYTAHDSIICRYNGSWTNWTIPAKKIELTGGRLWTTNYSDNQLYFLDQNSFYSIIDVIHNFSNRSNLYGLHFPVQGIGIDSTGNLHVLSYRYGNKTVYRIAPDFEVTNNDIDSITANFSNQSKLIFVGSTIYSIGFHSRLIKIDIDTSNYMTANFPGSANDFLDINNATVRMLNRGDMHWDPYYQEAQYYTDLNSLRKSVFASAIWLGGLDQGNQLHTAAMTYRQLGSFDFWTGPLDTLTGAADTISERYYDRFWKIDYNMIQGFIINYQNGNVQNGTYDIPEAIATWPAHGTGNHTKNLAPFIDANNDGVYNPLDGDFPELTGHQTLWWVFNDNANIHTETQGIPFGFEIQGKAYGFNCNLNTATDEVMNNTTFYQYKITNRSQNTYHDVYIGLWTDFDLGNASDDYVACDTMLNTYYCYNGDNDDDGNSSYAYGMNPPIMNVTVLEGPITQAIDGFDNNHNGLIDETNETGGLSSFLYYRSINLAGDGEPSSDSGYYYYLTARWLDGQHWTYGGSGRNIGSPPTNYLFSGIPYSLTPNTWTMVTAGLQPDDMRGTGSSGPFTIAPGESRTIDFAYIFTRDSINPNGASTSIAKNTSDVQKIINGFNSGNYPCLTSVGLPALNQPALNFNVYPNPSTNTLYFNKEMIGAEYKIYSVTGQLIKSGVYYGSAIPTENLTPQLYIIKASKAGQNYMKRFVKM